MRRWLWCATAVVMLLILAFVGRKAWRARRDADSRAAAIRQAGYQATLSKFSQDVKPGATRKAVKEYLQANGWRYAEMFISGQQTFGVWIKVGTEPPPLGCEAEPVSVVFDFAGDLLKPSEMDVLQKVYLKAIGAGCL